MALKTLRKLFFLIWNILCFSVGNHPDSTLCCYFTKLTSIPQKPMCFNNLHNKNHKTLYYLVMCNTFFSFGKIRTCIRYELAQYKMWIIAKETKPCVTALGECAACSLKVYLCTRKPTINQMPHQLTPYFANESGSTGWRRACTYGLWAWQGCVGAAAMCCENTLS